MIIGISLGIGDGDITAGMFYAIVLSVMISAVRGITAKPGESFWKTPI
jgi:hypothetical protein